MGIDTVIEVYIQHRHIVSFMGQLRASLANKIYFEEESWDDDLSLPQRILCRAECFPSGHGPFTLKPGQASHFYTPLG